MGALRPFRRFVILTIKNIHKLMSGLFNGVFSVIKGRFKLLFSVFGWLFDSGQKKPKDAKFMSWFEKVDKLKSSHSGLLVDGRGCGT